MGKEPLWNALSKPTECWAHSRVWIQVTLYLTLSDCNHLIESCGRRAVWRATRKCANSGGAAAPHTISRVEFGQDISVFTKTPSIQSTANAPVMPSSASATIPHALPPTTDLVVNPMRIPIASNHDGASISIFSPESHTVVEQRDPFQSESVESVTRFSFAAYSRHRDLPRIACRLEVPCHTLCTFIRTGGQSSTQVVSLSFSESLSVTLCCPRS